MPSRTFRKQGDNAPLGYFPWEAAGLRWLADAPGGVDVVQVLDVGEDFLDLERLVPTVPTNGQAEAFGAALARTHLAGADAYGSPPDEWHGDGWLGPLSDPLPLTLQPASGWGEFLARDRLAPMLAAGRRLHLWDGDQARVFERVMERVASGGYDTGDPPARLHGDLWAGNIVWTASGGVLIDPAAHGGHREADLAFLTLFPPTHLQAILGAYDDEAPLANGWRERVSLHLLHPLMLHAVLFRGIYVGQALAVARRWA